VRRRVAAALLGALLTQSMIGVGVAGAQVPQGDGSATGELLGNDGAGVNVDFRASDPGETATGGRRGRSNSNIVCRLTFATGSGRTNESLTQEELQAAYDQQVAAGRDSVSVVRVCADQNGNIVSTELINWAPGTPIDVDPEVLAMTARNWLRFPAPAGETSPPLATGTVAQLPTYLAIDNWAAVSETASAGPVSATVTATPVRQAWSIGGDVVAQCDRPGVLVEAGAPAPADACGWTPEHSSAGQRTRSESGEPCFNVTVTMTWDVSWTSNVVDGVQGLPAGTSSSTACVVVAEVQAVVSGER
jgi:hypothetical protein